MSVSSSFDFLLYSANTKEANVYKAVDPYLVYLSFLKNGWDSTNLFLAVGDTDDFFWQDGALSLEEIADICKQKTRLNETIGFAFRKEIDGMNEPTEITLLRHPSLRFSVLAHNRVKTDKGRTDTNWYISEIYQIAESAGYEIESIEFSEHV